MKRPWLGWLQIAYVSACLCLFACSANAGGLVIAWIEDPDPVAAKAAGNRAAVATKHNAAPTRSTEPETTPSSSNAGARSGGREGESHAAPATAGGKGATSSPSSGHQGRQIHPAASAGFQAPFLEALANPNAAVAALAQAAMSGDPQWEVLGEVMLSADSNADPIIVPSLISPPAAIALLGGEGQLDETAFPLSTWTNQLSMPSANALPSAILSALNSSTNEHLPISLSVSTSLDAQTTIESVPEPASIVLFGGIFGAAVLFFRRRRLCVAA